jgi:hypothetical protein
MTREVTEHDWDGIKIILVDPKQSPKEQDTQRMSGTITVMARAPEHRVSAMVTVCITYWCDLSKADTDTDINREQGARILQAVARGQDIDGCDVTGHILCGCDVAEALGRDAIEQLSSVGKAQ